MEHLDSTQLHSPLKVLQRLVESAYHVEVTPEQANTVMRLAVHCGAAPLVKSLFEYKSKLTGQTCFDSLIDSKTYEDLMHLADSGESNPMFDLRTHFRLRKIMELINEYNPSSFSQVQINAAPAELPQTVWTEKEIKEDQEFATLVFWLKRYRPNRVDLGLAPKENYAWIKRYLREKTQASKQ
jgi:hypothetical protein